jgi:hypothetical protein
MYFISPPGAHTAVTQPCYRRTYDCICFCVCDAFSLCDGHCDRSLLTLSVLSDLIVSLLTLSVLSDLIVSVLTLSVLSRLI